jgi:hypothetical protein
MVHGDLAHLGATPSPHFYDSLCDQASNRLSLGRPTDPVAGRKLGHRVDLGAWHQLTAADATGQLVVDAPVQWMTGISGGHGRRLSAISILRAQLLSR